MGMNLATRSEAFTPSEDQTWLGSAHGTSECNPITLDGDAFLSLFPTGIVPSGVVLYEHASGLYRPFAGVAADETVTLTEGGSGLTSWVLHWGGEDSASLDDDASVAQVQTAVDGLVGAGNVLVSGTTGPIAMTLQAQGDFADEDITAFTTTPTGGTGTVVVAVTVPGGTDTETAKGHLFTTTDLGGTTSALVDRTSAALYWHGEVIEANLPTNHGLTTGAKADLKHIHYV
jgi:hypothetical protein